MFKFGFFLRMFQRLLTLSNFYLSQFYKMERRREQMFEKQSKFAIKFVWFDWERHIVWKKEIMLIGVQWSLDQDQNLDRLFDYYWFFINKNWKYLCTKHKHSIQKIISNFECTWMQFTWQIWIRCNPIDRTNSCRSFFWLSSQSSTFATVSSPITGVAVASQLISISDVALLFESYFVFSIKTWKMR